MIARAIKIIVGIVLPIIILTVYISYRMKERSAEAAINAANQARVVASKAEVEMEYKWTLPKGQLDRGLNSDTLVVKNLVYDDRKMSFDTPYSYGGETIVGHYYLEKSGDKYRGSWSQSAPKDEGSIELEEAGYMTWTGAYTDRTGRQMTGTLRPKKNKEVSNL